MTQNYVKEDNLQTAMAEYQDNMGEGRTLYDQYERELGTVIQVYDNTGRVTLPPGVKELEALTGTSQEEPWNLFQERASRFMRL